MVSEVEGLPVQVGIRHEAQHTQETGLQARSVLEGHAHIRAGRAGEVQEIDCYFIQRCQLGEAIRNTKF